jgi:glycosyltransferase involved in cell wall biosynthesis
LLKRSAKRSADLLFLKHQTVDRRDFHDRIWRSENGKGKPSRRPSSPDYARFVEWSGSASTGKKLPSFRTAPTPSSRLWTPARLVRDLLRSARVLRLNRGVVVSCSVRKPCRILYICYASPTHTRLGPARRHYHVLDQLCRFYDVHLLSLGAPSEAAVFAREFGGRIRGYTLAPRSGSPGRTFARKAWRTLTGRCDFLPAQEPALQRLCVEITSTQSFDAILLSIVLLRRLPLPAGVPIIGDTHNVEFDVFRRMAARSDSVPHRHYARWQWPSMRREEQWCGRNVDLVLATSNRDRQVFETELGLKKVAVIPNGIDLAEFAASASPPQPATVVFSGLMSYYPNAQAVRWFLDAIFPIVRQKLPHVLLVVAGAAPPRWLRESAGDHLEVTGRVADMRPYLARAAVVVAPLLIGGGTRVKILEAAAMGKPVVSTSLGAEGLDLRHGESILLADEPQAFAAHVISLLEDPQRAARIGTNARSHVAEHFDWNRIGERVSRLLHARLQLAPRHDARNLPGEPLLKQVAHAS